MKKWLPFLLLVFVAPAAFATTLTGTIRDTGGNTITGTLWFELSQSANVNSGGCGGPYAIGPGNPAVFTLTNGVISGPGVGPYTVVGNDCITPTTTFYRLTAISTSGAIALRRNVSITGSSVDIGSLPVAGSSGTVPSSPIAGDVTGSLAATTVVKLQNVALSSSAPSTGNVLAYNGTQWAPSAAGAGSVTSVSGSGGTTGLTLTGGPITGSGTLTLGGTLGTANGGTNASSWTTGSVPFLSSSTAFGQDNANLFWDSTNKRFGIGTASPSSQLHVYAASGNAVGQVQSAAGTAAMQIRAAAASNQARVDLINPSISYNVGIGPGIGGNDLAIWDSTNSRMGFVMLAANGNVGINQSAPSQKLEVGGTIYSNSGGFKFPDGTTQITAAAGGGTVGGTGTAGYGTFWSATGTIAADSNFQWDNTNKALGLGGAPGGNRMFDVTRSAAATGAANNGAVITAIRTAADANAARGLLAQASATHTTGTVGSISAVVSTASTSGVGGTTTQANGFVAQSSAGASSTITTRNGVYVAEDTGSGTITNQNGIYIEALTRGGTDYAIQTAGTTPSLFGGLVTATGGFSGGGVCNVMAYGATNNDTDAASATTNAIQSAITACAALSPRGTVYFPPGTYRTTGGYNLNGLDGLQIVGAGVGSTTINLNHATNNLFYTTSTNTSNLGLRHFKVTSSAVTRTAGWVFEVANGQAYNATGTLKKSRFEDLEIQLQMNGLWIKKYEFVWIDKVQFWNPVTGGGVGIKAGMTTTTDVNQGSELYIAQTEIYGNDLAGGVPLLSVAYWIEDTDAVYLRNSGAGSITDNDLKIVANSGGHAPTNHFFNTAVFDATKNGPNVYLTGAGTIDRITFTGSWFCSAGQLTGGAAGANGFKVDVTTMGVGQITGSMFYNNKGTGLYLTSNGTGFQVSGNTFYWNGLGAQANNNDGIYVGSGTGITSAIITGNGIYNSNGASIRSAATANKLVVTGNVLMQAAVYGVAPQVNQANGN